MRGSLKPQGVRLGDGKSVRASAPYWRTRAEVPSTPGRPAGLSPMARFRIAAQREAEGRATAEDLAFLASWEG